MHVDYDFQNLQLVSEICIKMLDLTSTDYSSSYKYAIYTNGTTKGQKHTQWCRIPKQTSGVNIDTQIGLQ